MLRSRDGPEQHAANLNRLQTEQARPHRGLSKSLCSEPKTARAIHAPVLDSSTNLRLLCRFTSFLVRNPCFTDSVQDRSHCSAYLLAGRAHREKHRTEPYIARAASIGATSRHAKQEASKQRSGALI